MGRKRKPGPRTPSGQPSRSKEAIEQAVRIAYEDGPQQTVLQARRRHKRPFSDTDPHWRDKTDGPVSKEHVTAHKLDARGSILGILWADGHITAQEREAGADYAQRYITYASLHGLPRPTPQGPAYGEVRGSTRPDNILAARYAKAAHDADQAILRQHGRYVVDAMRRACIMDERAILRLLQIGLRALVKAGK